MPQRILICLLLSLLYADRPAWAQETTLCEADAKAAFLYNFSKVVDWPADAFSKEDAPFVVGIFGDQDFVSTVRKLFDERKAHGHPFLVRRLTQNGEAKACHLLFVRESETRRFGAIYESIKRLPVLTVGESEEFLDAGGMFSL